jgi:hypothetical protein
MRIEFFTPSSYFIEAKASRGGARYFDALPSQVVTRADTHHPSTIIDSSCLPCQCHSDSLRATACQAELTTWKQEAASSFQVVGEFT